MTKQIRTHRCVLFEPRAGVMSLRGDAISRFCNADPSVEPASSIGPRSFARDARTAGYLRHCVLAVTKAGPAALDSFLDETFLVDRATPLRDYLAANPQVMETLPPPSLEGRYSG